MQNKQKRGTWVIILTLLIALILSVIPLPESWLPYRPDWILLVFSYWVIALPHRIGLLWAFVWGLIFDALGRSLVLTLERHGQLVPEEAAKEFEEGISEHIEAGVRRVARLALEEKTDAG